jgi:serine O-acetyltransferase
MNEEFIRNELRTVTEDILADYQKGRDIDKINVFDQPDNDVIIDITRKLLNILFPGYYREKTYRSYHYDSRIAVLIEDVAYNLRKQIAIALVYRNTYRDMEYDALQDEAARIVIEFFRRIPKVRELVDTDIQATFGGDPAAFFKEEIVLCYPGLLASTINRLAHELYLMKVPLIPRMMTEYAHSRTGIDINPGATIGRYFCMDHGTGIVVGETSIIGEHVKVYQGVTIGALSTRGGQRLRGNKRHPTIEDYVTIYAGASVLGGDTIIGRGSVIGANVFITSSVAPETRVGIKTQELIVKRHGETVELVPTEESKEKNNVWYYTI